MDRQLAKMFKIKQLDENIYCISASMVNTYVILGKEKAMVIDTGYGFRDLMQVVREITDLPLVVINTHGHVDHSGGNFYFAEPVYIHKFDYELYKKHNSPEMHRELEKTLKFVNRVFFWRELITKNPEENDEQRYEFDHFEFIKEGDTFNLGNLTAQIIEIPGHTQGSIAVYFPEIRLIVTSDGANAACWLFLPESTNLSTYEASLHKLEAYDFDRILTGHTDKFFGRDDLAEWIDLAENLDIENGKKQKEDFLAKGADVRNCWNKKDSRHRGSYIVVDVNKK